MEHRISVEICKPAKLESRSKKYDENGRKTN